jgi:hypothetical protein
VNAFALRRLCNQFGVEMLATPMNLIVMNNMTNQAELDSWYVFEPSLDDLA